MPTKHSEIQKLAQMETKTFDEYRLKIAAQRKLAEIAIQYHERNRK